MLQQILRAAKTYDRPKSERLVASLGRRARRGMVAGDDDLRKALTALRDNRWFDLLGDACDALLQSGEKRAFVSRLYAQALIDTGHLSAAITFLERAVDKSSGAERDELRGLLGRAWKQAYVGDAALSEALAKKLIARSLEQYYTPYVEKPRKNVWHGINTVAVLARARRDGIRVARGYPDHRELATSILETVRRLGKRARPWDFSTAAEACVALGRWEEGLQWLERYLDDCSAFAAAGTLRQFTEVWRLTERGEGGSLLHLLEAEMLAKKGGQEIDATRARAALHTLDRRVTRHEAILGADKYQTLEWYRTGLRRSAAVARVRDGFTAWGTGFLFDFQGEQLFMTNHHVVPQRVPTLSRAIVTFEALDGGTTEYGVAEQLWTSPVDKLDATILRLSRKVRGVEPFPVCTELPACKPPTRVYVIGHPRGGTLSFSIADNHLVGHEKPYVHYRAPTEEGSSGSPVFDDRWYVLALHHGAVELRSGSRVEWANEGSYFQTILDRFRAARAKSPKLR